MDRRQFLWISGVAMAGLAGCNSQDPSEAETTTSDTETTTPSTSANEPGEIQFEVNNREIQLPPIWSGHSIEDVSARVNANVSDPDGLQSVILRSGDETIREFDSWENGAGKQFSLKPGEIPVEGSLSLVAQDSAGDTFSEELDVAKAVPSAFKIDVVPEMDQELRTQAHESEGENYLVRQTPLDSEDGLITDDLVFNYSSHEDLSFDKLPVDLAGMEYWHDNDTHYINETHRDEVAPLLEALGTGEGYEDIREPDASFGFYPNHQETESSFGRFVYEEFADANNAGEAMDWLHPLFFLYQDEHTKLGPMSSEDFMYATFFQEAFDEHTDLETHVWPFKIGVNGEHGNGLIWDETSDELYVMETITKPSTATIDDPQRHPSVKESNYMKGDWLWHPLRFGLEQEEASQYSWEPDRWPDEDTFRRKKNLSFYMLAKMGSFGHDDDFTIEKGAVAPTTGYVKNVTERLRNYDSNDFDFQEILNQAKVINKLTQIESQFIAYGDVENPRYALLDNTTKDHYGEGDLLWDILNDMDGEYNDFDQYIEDNASYEEVNQGLGTSG